MQRYWRDDIDPAHEPHKVLIVRDVLVDEARGGRPVKLKVYYPVNHNLTKLPVIFWSHGLGGSVDGSAFISRFLASYGYIIVHVQHHGTDSSLWEGKPGHPWDIIRKTHIPRSVTLERFADIPFVLGKLQEWMEGHEEVALHADLSTIGMSGHSFGAMTTQVMCGMMFPDEEGKLRSYKQDIFKCGLLYSPVPIQHLAKDDPDDLYGSIDRPLFFMTGSEDDSPVEGWPYTERLVVYEHCGNADKHLQILKGGDHMVYNGSRGKLGANPNRHLHEEIIKVSALAWWDAMLKDDAAAGEWLFGSGVQDVYGEHLL